MASNILGGFLSISLEWLIIYEALMAIGLLLIPWWLLAVTMAGAASIVTLLLPHISQLRPLMNWFGHLGIYQTAVDPINLLIIFVVIILATAIFVHVNGGRFDSPTWFGIRETIERPFINSTNYRFSRFSYLFPVIGFTPAFRSCRYFRLTTICMQSCWYQS